MVQSSFIKSAKNKVKKLKREYEDEIPQKKKKKKDYSENRKNKRGENFQ